MKEETLQNLKIHKLSEEQYYRELIAGRIDESAIYLTPDDDSAQFPVDAIVTNLKNELNGYSQGFDYQLNDDGESYSITSIGSCTDNHLILPEEHEGKPIIGINQGAFVDNSQISGITFSKNLQSIGDSAFRGCVGLNGINIVIPKTIKIILNDAFYYAGTVGPIFYCEAEEKPEGWEAYWNSISFQTNAGDEEYLYAKTIWGFANDFVSVNEKLKELDEKISNTNNDVLGTWVFNDTLSEVNGNTPTLPDDGYTFINGDTSIMYVEDETGFIYCQKSIGGETGATDLAYQYEDGWVDDNYKTLTITEEPSAEASAWLKANATKQLESAEDEMPQIRFVNQRSADLRASISTENPMQLSIELIGGGPLHVGDALQICSRKNYNYKRKDDDGNVIGIDRKRKLKCFKEYVITEDDLNHKCISLSLTKDTGKERYALQHNGRTDSARITPLYLRIRRASGGLQRNSSGQSVDAKFSNVVQVWMSYNGGNVRIH